MTEYVHAVVIGGGAAGYFGAIRCAEAFPGCRVLVLERSANPLGKVRISGGGRCNVTHHCFEPAELVRNYPRGARELRGPFSRFQPRDTIDWFSSRGVPLKTEEDGRVFPVSDRSQTIIDCLSRSAEQAGVEVRLGVSVAALETAPGLEPVPGGPEGRARFLVRLESGAQIAARRVLLATGSSHAGYRMAAALGHPIEPPVPSLFTFNIDDDRLRELAGLSFPACQLALSIPSSREVLRQAGPVLITHWGLSGPAVLKLSAWGARALHDSGYRATLTLDVLPGWSPEALFAELQHYKEAYPRRSVSSHCFLPIPRRFWQRLVERAGVLEAVTWAGISKGQMRQIAEALKQGRYEVQGKGVFKEEFVTCGGVRLKEIDFKTLESRLCPGLHFAGEILDIDGITGGFNFQNAWTTGWIAGSSMRPEP